jgi:hypothetical protein
MENLQTALRTETLKAIVKAMHNCLTENVWERLFAAKGDFTAKQRCVSHSASASAVEVRQAKMSGTRLTQDRSDLERL